MMPGNLVLWRSRPVSSPMSSSCFIPSMSLADRSIESAWGLMDWIMDLLRLEYLSFSSRRASRSLELDLKTRLDLFLNWPECVIIMLFLDLQLTPVAPTK